MRSFVFPMASLLTLTAAAALAPACAAPTDAISSSSALVIDPTGSENESHVILQLPTDACLPGATCSKVLGQTPTIYLDEVSTALGANTRLKPGTHTIAVNGLGYQVTTAADQTLTVTLPIAAGKCVDASLPNVPTTDFGSSVSVSNVACPTTVTGPATGVPSATNPTVTVYYNAGCTTAWSYITTTPNCTSASTTAPYSSDSFSYMSGGQCVTAPGIGYSACMAASTAAISAAASPTGTAPLTAAFEAYPPVTLTATVNSQPQTLTLNPGDEVDFTVNLPALGTVPSTFATTLTFLSARANPDAAKGTITSSCAGDRSYTIASATSTTAIPAPITLNAFVDSACTYTLNVGGRTQTLSQTAANAISLNRLDVNAVTITREDGTTYTVNGTYSLNYGGVQVAGPYATGTGIDVLPGTYQFSLSYTDFDGPQTQTQTLTF